MGIRWYGLAYLAGFVGSYLIFVWLAKRGRIQLPVDRAGDFITWVAIGTLAGGRLGYCLFYSPELFWQFSSELPFWGVLEVHKGGMASHGGFLGVILVCLWFAHRGKYSRLHLVDLTSYGCTIGFTFGRIANFINGELYGRAADESFKWAVKFPTELYYWANYQVQELKRLVPVLPALGGVKDSKGQMLNLTPEVWNEWVNRYRLDSVAHENVNAVIEQVITATQTGQTAVIDALQTVLTPRHASQLYQSFLEGFLVWVVLTLFWLKPRKAGLVASLFGFCYSIARIIGEQFRMPDAHIGYQWLGLTRGQWLSVGFFALSTGYLIVTLKTDNPRLGGLLKGPDEEKP